MKKRRRRRVPCGDRAPLSDRDILGRLHDVWTMLSPRDGGTLSEDDLQFIHYNFALAELYGTLRGLGTGGGCAMGFQAASDEVAGGSEDYNEGDDVEEWHVAGEVYNHE